MQRNCLGCYCHRWHLTFSGWSPLSGCNFHGGNYLGGNYPGGNCPGGNYPGGNCPGGNYPGGSCPVPGNKLLIQVYLSVELYESLKCFDAINQERYIKRLCINDNLCWINSCLLFPKESAHNLICICLKNRNQNVLTYFIRMFHFYAP